MAREGTFTPQPWWPVDEGDGNFAIRAKQGPIEVQVARVFSAVDAPVVAAAPKLLAALRGMLRATDHWNDWEPGATERKAARAALQSAEPTP